MESRDKVAFVEFASFTFVICMMNGKGLLRKELICYIFFSNYLHDTFFLVFIIGKFFLAGVIIK